MKRLASFALAALVAVPALAQEIDFRPAASSGGGAATAVTPGVTTVTGCTSQVVIADAGSTLNCDTGFGYDPTNNALSVTTVNAGALGANQVTNGTFTGAATGWTLGGGGGAPDWAYASNNVTHASGGGTTALQPSTPLTVTAGTRYAVLFILSSYTSGTLTPGIGGATGGAVAFNTSLFTSNSWYEVITATTTANLVLTPSNDFAGTIDDVQVYPLTLAPAAFAVKPVSGSTYPNEFRVHGSGNGSTFEGYQAGEAQTNGTFNHAIGTLAMKAITAGSQNIAMGTNAMNTMTSGASNTGLGTGAMRFARVGSRNTALGAEALNAGLGFFDNVAVGYQAGNAAGIGSQNTLVGASSQASTFSYCHAYGYGATCTASNQGVFGSSTASAGMDTAYWGHGVTKVSPGAFAMRGTGGSGSDNAGSSWTASGGAGTGLAVGGDYIIQRFPDIATGSTAQTGADAFYVRSKKKALTAATATAFARINLASGVAAVTGWTGGTVFYTLVANDAADFQSRSGHIDFSIVNKAGAETCAFGTGSTESIANSSGTTTLTFDTDVAGPTNGCDLRATGASSLTETTLSMFYSIILNGPGTVTPQ